MTQAEKDAFKIKLRDAVEMTKTDIENLKELTKPIPPENSLGRVTRMDAINNKSVNEANLRRAISKLDKLQKALRKVDSPEFGNCQSCRRPIQPKRLMFMPESTRCMRCAR